MAHLKETQPRSMAFGGFWGSGRRHIVKIAAGLAIRPNSHVAAQYCSRARAASSDYASAFPMCG